MGRDATSDTRPPRIVRALNRAGRRLPAADLVPEALVDWARTATGLHDLGEPSILEALPRLCASLTTDQTLTPLGRLVARDMVAGGLAARLRVVDHHRRRPELASEQVEAPIVIVGLPRTGSTLLHRLLAAHPRLRGPRYWEMVDPTPPIDLTPAAVAGRIRRAERALQATRFVVPGMRAIHDSRADEADECIMLMGNDLTSLSFVIAFDVAGYRDWLTGIDHTTVYANHRRQLQVLQYGASPCRWVLKAPGHLLGLPGLVTTYPDALIVQLHRDPGPVVASTASLLAHAQAPFVEHDAEADRGATVAHLLGEWARRFATQRAALEARPTPAGVRFVDIDYPDLLADPVGVAATIAARLGDDTAAGREAMHRYLADHPQHEHGRHHYDLAGIGLDPGVAEQALLGS